MSNGVCEWCGKPLTEDEKVISLATIHTLFCEKHTDEIGAAMNRVDEDYENEIRGDMAMNLRDQGYEYEADLIGGMSFDDAKDTYYKVIE